MKQCGFLNVTKNTDGNVTDLNIFFFLSDEFVLISSLLLEKIYHINEDSNATSMKNEEDR